MSRGDLYAWGVNYAGKLGLGDTTDRAVPVLLPTGGWAFVSMDDEPGNMPSAVAAVATDGTLWVWGTALGLGGAPAPYVPTQVGTDTHWQSVRCVSAVLLATKTDGTLWVTGGSYGTTMVQVGADTDWAPFTEGQRGDAAVHRKQSGALWYTGVPSGRGDAAGSPAAITGFSEAPEGSAHYGYLVKADGTLWYEFYRGLTRTQVGTDTNWSGCYISAEAGGTAPAVAVKANGERWVWGDNSYYTLGRGNSTATIDKASPLLVDTGWAFVITQPRNWGTLSFGVKTNGTLWGWGHNGRGQLTGGAGGAVYSPVQIGADTDWSTVSLSSTPVFAVALRKTDGSVYGLGDGAGSGAGTVYTPTLLLGVAQADVVVFAADSYIARIGGVPPVIPPFWTNRINTVETI